MDNAIALCLTCHTDVHTKAPFTRRFTVAELKTHRDNVCRLVAEGSLPAGNESGLEGMTLAVAEAISRSPRRGSGFDLIPRRNIGARGSGFVGWDNTGLLRQ